MIVYCVMGILINNVLLILVEVAYLGTTGGRDAAETVRRIMASLLSNILALEFN